MIRKDRFSTFCTIFVSCLALMSVFPTLYLLLVSLSSESAMYSGNIWEMVKSLSFDSYTALYKYSELPRSLLNSVFLTIVGTLINMFFTIPCSYALSRGDFKGRKVTMVALLFTMFFRGSIIPNYMWMRTLGLTDSFWAVWLSKGISVYNIFLLRTFFERVQKSTIEAAQLDGANELVIMFKIIVPSCIPGVLTASIFYAVSWWNEYYLSLMYISDPAKFTLPLRIVQMTSNITESSRLNVFDTMYGGLSAYGVRAGGIILSIIPALFILFVLQKYYINEIMFMKRNDRK